MFFLSKYYLVKAKRSIVPSCKASCDRGKKAKASGHTMWLGFEGSKAELTAGTLRTAIFIQLSSRPLFKSNFVLKNVKHLMNLCNFFKKSVFPLRIYLLSRDKT